MELLQGVRPKLLKDLWARLTSPAKNSQYSFEDLASQFYQINRNSPEILRSFISLLFRTVAADGKLHPAEESALERIRRVLRIGFLMRLGKAELETLVACIRDRVRLAGK